MGYNMTKEITTMEHWKAIAGYEGLYEVSDQGRVKSLNYNHTGQTRILKAQKTRKGYLLIHLHKDGQSKYMQVHRLVASAFIPNPNNLETVNHKDEVKTNNAASNLEWMSVRDNINYGTGHRRGAEAQVNDPKKSKPVQQFDKQGNLLAVFRSIHEAERVTGISRRQICRSCNGERELAGGFVWRYV